MNKLSILIILCLFIFSNCLDYEIEINFSSNEFNTENSKGLLQFEDNNQRKTNYIFTLIMEPNTYQLVNTKLDYKIEDIKKVLFNYEKFKAGKADHIFLDKIKIIPKYILDPIQRVLKTKHLCHSKGRNQKLLSKFDSIQLIECD